LRPDLPSPSVRVADPKDAQALAALHGRAFDDPWPVTMIADLLDGEGMIALVSEQAGTARGFVLARVVVDEAEILTLAVDPASRRTGIGAALLAKAIDLAAANGALALFLEVAVDNQAALGLYDRHGFAKVGRRRAYYTHADGQAIDALVLRRNLNKTAD
jgi:ribosomal-protein-alanine N-acetyltransferase